MPLEDLNDTPLYNCIPLCYNKYKPSEAGDVNLYSRISSSTYCSQNMLIILEHHVYISCIVLMGVPESYVAMETVCSDHITGINTSPRYMKYHPVSPDMNQFLTSLDP